MSLSPSPAGAAMATQGPSSDESPNPAAAKRERKPNIRLGDLGERKPYPKRSKPLRRRGNLSTRPSPDPGADNQRESPDSDTKHLKRRRGKPPTDNSGPENQRESSDIRAGVRVSEDNRELISLFDMHESEEADDDLADQNGVEDHHGINQSGGGSGLAEMGGVHGWLDRLGLARYRPVFDTHEVDEVALPLLTLEDLRDMGITAVGSRRRLHCAIQELKKRL